MTLLALAGAVLTVLLLVPAPPARRLRRRLAPEAPAGIRGRRRRVLGGAAGALLAGAVVVLVALRAGPAAAVVLVGVGIATATTARLLRTTLREQRATRTSAEVATACGVLASYLRVGQVAATALTLAAQDCPVLGPAAGIQEVGGEVGPVWRAQARRPGHGGLVDLARAWEVSTSTGAPLSPALEQVATGLAADQTLRALVAGELSAPRATGKLMAVLPLAGVGLGYALGGRPLQWLVAGPLGWACLLLGLVLAAVGVLWIEALARTAAAT